MCKVCGFAYSFAFGVQFHRADCAGQEVERKIEEELQRVHVRTSQHNTRTRTLLRKTHRG